MRLTSTSSKRSLAVFRVGITTLTVASLVSPQVVLEGRAQLTQNEEALHLDISSKVNLWGQNRSKMLKVPAGEKLGGDLPQWARQLGTSSDEAVYGVATDRNGNIYIAGATGGALAGTNQGYFDAWIARYNPTGALLWKRQLGSSNIDVARGVATDKNGNVYVAGPTFGALGGTNQGSVDGWVAKYSPTGALLWKRQLGTPGYDDANGVATDSNGNVYIAGSTSSSLGGTNKGRDDGWVAKYNPTGSLLWKKQLGTSFNDSTNGVATDSTGNVYIAGTTFGSLGGTNKGIEDAWVAKYSPTGALRWKKQLGTPLDDLANEVATDKNGNVYIAGTTNDSLGGIDQGRDDGWVAKYSPTGALLWKKQLGTSGYDRVWGVATDRNGNAYIAGETEGSLGSPNQGSYDGWVAKYSPAGSLLWKKQLGTSGYDIIYGLATDSTGHIYIGGTTNGSLGGTLQGSLDAWVAKYSQR